MLKLSSFKGFTIVELLIVIVIISILATISVLGYVTYQKNAQRSQIAATVKAYQHAINSTAFENDATPAQTNVSSQVVACASSNDSTCCLSGLISTNVVCAKNSEFSNFGYPSTDIYNTIKKHLPANSLKLPKLGNTTLPACGEASGSTSPCNTQEIGYLATVAPVSGGVMIDPQSPKGVLNYFLPVDFDCGSSDVMTYTINPGKYEFTDAKFSRRVTTGATPFTECVVGIR